MKIRVTLEKADILRLVLAHLEKSNLHPTPHQDIKYRGALEVDLLVEVDDRAQVPLATSPPASPTGKDAPLPPPLDDGKTIEQVLAESARIERDDQALKRRLGKDEFRDFPRGGSR